MGMSLAFKTKAVDLMLKDIQRNVNKIEQLKKEYVVSISALVFKNIMEHFRNTEGPTGNWPEWSDSYTKHMRRKGKGANLILQDTGRLRNNFKRSSYRKTSKGLMWYNDARSKKTKTSKGGWPYAAMHNYGGRNEQGAQVPQRQFMWISDEAMNEISEVTAAFTLKGLR